MAEFKTADRNGVHLVTFPELVDGEEAGLEAAVKTWLMATPDVHVFDMKETIRFKPSAYRFFLMFNQALKANKKKLFCLNANPSLHSQFKQDGLTAVFAPIGSLEEAQRRAVPSRPMVDVELINPFIEATKRVLETQAKLTLVQGRPYLRKPDQILPMEIAGLIALSCSEFTGSIALCFKSQVFLNIYEGLVGEKQTEINQDTQDAAGELLNMIFGMAKTALNDKKGYSLDKAVPTVLWGEKLKIHHQTRNPAIILPFEGPAGAFHIEISIQRAEI